MYAAMIALEMTYTPCARNSKGLGGKLTETELRGPNCDATRKAQARQENVPGPSWTQFRTKKPSRGSHRARRDRTARTPVSLHAVDDAPPPSTTSSFYSKDREESEATTTSKHALGAPEEARDRLRDPSERLDAEDRLQPKR